MPVLVVHYFASFFPDALILKEAVNDTRSVPAFLISGLPVVGENEYGVTFATG